MSGKIYIDVHPCGSFSSGMFWGDVQHYAATTPAGVTSYFAEAPGVSTEEIPHQLKVWRSHQVDERGDFNQWAAFCIQKWGVWFERVTGSARRSRIEKAAPASDTVSSQILRQLSIGTLTHGVLMNRCRKFPRVQVEGCLSTLVTSGQVYRAEDINESNGRKFFTYRRGNSCSGLTGAD